MATPNHPQLGGGESSRSSVMPYQLEVPGSYPTPTSQVSAEVSCGSMPAPVPDSAASASGNDVAIGILCLLCHPVSSLLLSQT